MAIKRIVTYPGPACPRCGVQLALDKITPGEDICPSCRGFFFASVFHPAQRLTRVLQLAESGPEATATSCANHPRNAAVTSCERCGLFICSLCELDLFGGKYCPSCFDRMTKEGGEVQQRFRDWVALSLATSVLGLIFAFAGIPITALTFYYVVRGFRDPETTRDRYASLVIATLIALAGIAISIVMIRQLYLK